MTRRRSRSSRSPRRVLRRRSSGKARRSRRVTRRSSPKQRTYKRTRGYGSRERKYGVAYTSGAKQRNLEVVRAAGWGRQMTRELTERRMGPENMHIWDQYEDDSGMSSAHTIRFQACQPDPERVMACVNIIKNNWATTRILLNHVQPTRWGDGNFKTSQTDRNGYMQNSKELNNMYTERNSTLNLFGRPVYTRLPYGKFMFTDQEIDKIPSGPSNMYPTAAIHVHTHPKWRYLDGDGGSFVCCKLWVPENTPLYFYMNHNTGMNFAALLFVHTVYVSDMYSTEENNNTIRNLVMNPIGVYEPDEVDLIIPERNLDDYGYIEATPEQMPIFSHETNTIRYGQPSDS